MTVKRAPRFTKVAGNCWVGEYLLRGLPGCRWFEVLRSEGAEYYLHLPLRLDLAEWSSGGFSLEPCGLVQLALALLMDMSGNAEWSRKHCGRFAEELKVVLGRATSLNGWLRIVVTRGYRTAGREFCLVRAQFEESTVV